MENSGLLQGAKLHSSAFISQLSVAVWSVSSVALGCGQCWLISGVEQSICQQFWVHLIQFSYWNFVWFVRFDPGCWLLTQVGDDNFLIIPRMGDVVSFDLSDGVFTGREPHTSHQSNELSSFLPTQETTGWTMGKKMVFYERARYMYCWDPPQSDQNDDTHEWIRGQADA